MLNNRTTFLFFEQPVLQSPETRGGCDRYYRRSYNPHYLLGTGLFDTTKVGQADMTAEEIAQYKKGWREEPERKDWGHMHDGPDDMDEDTPDEFNREERED